jgi:glycosyltransferase involved in cell wall biosynthesis
MRIAQVAPLWERVPPPAYGGIELVVALLCNELVRQGHEVTLFASGDSVTDAKLESVHPQALRLDSSVKEYGIYEMLNLARVYERADEFDVIHSHIWLRRQLCIPFTVFSPRITKSYSPMQRSSRTSVFLIPSGSRD